MLQVSVHQNLRGDRLPELLTPQGWDEAMKLSNKLPGHTDATGGGRGEGHTRKTPGTMLTTLAEDSKCPLAGPSTSFHSREL